MSRTSAAQLTIVSAAVLLALWPPGPFTVERYYARWLYPIVQSWVTPISNRVPFALFDATLVALASTMIAIWIRAIRRGRKKQWLRSLGRGVVSMLVLLAFGYLWFLGGWGLNYARPPLESQMPFDAARITPQAVRALTEHSIRRANQTYSAAHAAGFPPIDARPARLMEALHQVEREFGRPRPTIFATPKWSILTPFYRASGVSGQLGPFFLETLLNPDLTAGIRRQFHRLARGAQSRSIGRIQRVARPGLRIGQPVAARDATCRAAAARRRTAAGSRGHSRAAEGTGASCGTRGLVHL